MLGFLPSSLLLVLLLVALMVLFHSDGENDVPKSLLKRIEKEKTLFHVSPCKFAILISGTTDARHKENLSLAYQVLLENKFKRENIYILDKKGRKKRHYPVDDFVSKKSIRILFQHLAKRISSHDFLFVYNTSHGNREERCVEVNGKQEREEVSVLAVAKGNNLDEFEFASLLADVKFQTGVFLFDQCFGGGFAERTAGRGRITMSASKKWQVSHSNTFPQALFTAFRKRAADINGYEKVSVREAFNFARQNDEFAKAGEQTPQIYDCINSEVFL